MNYTNYYFIDDENEENSPGFITDNVRRFERYILHYASQDLQRRGILSLHRKYIGYKDINGKYKKVGHHKFKEYDNRIKTWQDFFVILLRETKIFDATKEKIPVYMEIRSTDLGYDCGYPTIFIRIKRTKESEEETYRIFGVSDSENIRTFHPTYLTWVHQDFVLEKLNECSVLFRF